MTTWKVKEIYEIRKIISNYVQVMLFMVYYEDECNFSINYI